MKNWQDVQRELEEGRATIGHEIYKNVPDIRKLKYNSPKWQAYRRSKAYGFLRRKSFELYEGICPQCHKPLSFNRFHLHHLHYTNLFNEHILDVAPVHPWCHLEDIHENRLTSKIEDLKIEDSWNLNKGEITMNATSIATRKNKKPVLSTDCWGIESKKVFDSCQVGDTLEEVISKWPVALKWETFRYLGFVKVTDRINKTRMRTEITYLTKELASKSADYITRLCKAFDAAWKLGQGNRKPYEVWDNREVLQLLAEGNFDVDLLKSQSKVARETYKKTNRPGRSKTQPSQDSSGSYQIAVPQLNEVERYLLQQALDSGSIEKIKKVETQLGIKLLDLFG